MRALPLAQPDLSITVCKMELRSGVLYLEPSDQAGKLTQLIAEVKEKASNSVLFAGALGLSASTK
jgi:hypothetical protein